jgi:hypothetical protein
VFYWASSVLCLGFHLGNNKRLGQVEVETEGEQCLYREGKRQMQAEVASRQKI